MKLTYEIGSLIRLSNGLKRDVKLFVNGSKNEIATVTAIQKNGDPVTVMSIQSHTTEPFVSNFTPIEDELNLADTESLENALNSGALDFISTLVEAWDIPDKTYLGDEIFEKQDDEFENSNVGGSKESGGETSSEVEVDITITVKEKDTANEVEGALVEIVNNDSEEVVASGYTDGGGKAIINFFVNSGESTDITYQVSEVTGFQFYSSGLTINPDEATSYEANADLITE